MRIRENVTLYNCDFCNKELKRKHAMVNHELKCRDNPANYQPCFRCKYMQKQNDGGNEKFYVAGGEVCSDYVDSMDYYFCNKLKKKMYTINAVHKNLIEKYPETFDEQEQMPLLTCESFETNKISERMQEINDMEYCTPMPFDDIEFRLTPPLNERNKLK